MFSTLPAATSTRIKDRTIRRNGRSILAMMVVAGAAAGCTMAKMETDNAQRQVRVDDKTIELQQEEQIQSELSAQGRQLVQDLQGRDMAIDEMETRLRQLQRLNARSRAATSALQQRKENLRRALEEATAEVKKAKLERGLDQAAKEKQLEKLRKDVRSILEFLEQS